MPSREKILAAALLGIGVAIFALAFAIREKQREQFAERPDGAGDVGFLSVWAQLPNGPVKLQVGRKRVLARPQHLAFQFTANGSGPRILKIESHLSTGEQILLHEEKIDTPKDAWSLDYVMELDDDAPDAFTLIVEVEAPHTRGYRSSYPLILTGASKDRR